MSNRLLVGRYELIEKMSTNPARILKKDNIGNLSVGSDADITVIDPDREYTVEKNKLHSKGKNTPVAGRKVKGIAACTIVGGKIVAEYGELK